MKIKLVLWRMFFEFGEFLSNPWVVGILDWCYNPYSILGMPSLIVFWLGRPEFIESVYFSKDTFLVEVFDNIIEVSTGAFYVKIMRFASFLRVQIHSWNANVSWILQSTSSERGATWYWAVPPSRSFYIIFVSLFIGIMGERIELWIGRRGGGREIDMRNWSVFNNRENSFPYFFFIYLYWSYYL